MRAIREFAKVHNQTISIKLPDYFDYEEVEAVIMPKIDTDDLSRFEKEIEKGMDSPISPKTHDEIFARLKTKYAD
jgi:hypothetical protein